MNDFITASVVWVLVGAVWTYYIDKKAYREGMVDAVIMHNRGQLTYETFVDESGDLIVEFKVEPYED
jgi:predicted TIM-barrel enzyme